MANGLVILRFAADEGNVPKALAFVVAAGAKELVAGKADGFVAGGNALVTPKPTLLFPAIGAGLPKFGVVLDPLFKKGFVILVGAACGKVEVAPGRTLPNEFEAVAPLTVLVMIGVENGLAVAEVVTENGLETLPAGVAKICPLLEELVLIPAPKGLLLTAEDPKLGSEPATRVGVV